MVRPFGSAALVALVVSGVALEACQEATASRWTAAAPTPVIEFLSAVPESDDVPFQSFRKAWTQVASGHCATASLRHVQASGDQLPALVEAARSIAARRPAVVVAPTEASALAARTAGDVPLVFASFLNPIRARIITSEGVRPENVTGISLDDRLLGKRLEILHEAFPAARKIGFLVDAAWRADSDLDRLLAEAHARSGLNFFVGEAEVPQQVAGIFAAKEAADVDAWYIPATYVGYLAEAQILEHMRRTRTPAMHATLAEVRNGALMAYAQDTSFAYDALATLSNRVCNGERAGDIPIERPRRYVLSIRADYDMGGSHIAAGVVARADKIE